MIIEMIQMTHELLVNKNYEDDENFMEKTSKLIEFLQSELKCMEDEYEILKPYAEKVGMLKEFEDVYNKFWPLEHMTYEDVQKLYNNAKGR